jgi:Fe-S-cluster-containing dehydrogenase component
VHQENNHDRRTNQSYIRVLEMEQGSMDMERGTVHYDHAVPAPGKFYMPVQCQQCENPPCTHVCPVEATWQEADGIVVVDYNWCIGCRYCEAACPYHARRFNWTAPEIPAEEINPDQGLSPTASARRAWWRSARSASTAHAMAACPRASRRARPARGSSGTCWTPTPRSAGSSDNKRVFVLKEELGTRPRFYYFFDN